MPIPNVKVQVNPTGVGIILAGLVQLPPNVSGWCSSGPAAEPTTIGAGAISSLTDTFGVGTAVELAAAILAQGAQAVVVTRIYGGTIASPFTNVGGGPAVTASGNPLKPYGTPTATGSSGIEVEITLGGVLGTSRLQYTLDGGVTFLGPFPTASSFPIPGTGITLTMAAGTYILNATYTGAITTALGSSSSVEQLAAPGQALTGAGLVSMDAVNNPQDAYDVVVLVTQTGLIGAGQYSWSIDGGLNFQADALIPSSNPSVLGSTGIAIDWANTGGGGGTNGFIQGETYNFTTLAPQLSSTEIVQTLLAIQGSGVQWDWCHVPGTPTSIGNAAGLFSALATVAEDWWAATRFSWIVMDGPTCTTTNNQSTAIVAAFANLESDLMSIGGGDFNCVSALSGSDIQRNASWAASIWGSTLAVGIDLSAPALGSLPFAAELLWNENNTPAFDAGGFTSLRTIPFFDGNYITNARIKCSPSSDIVYWQSRRVLNAAARIAYKRLVTLLSTPILVDATSGHISAAAATAIQNDLMREINSGLSGQITGSSVIVDRTTDVLTTETMNLTVGVTPLFYPKFIDCDIGYVNPAVSTQ